MQNEPLLENEIAFVLSDVPNGRAIARTFLVEESDKYTLNQRIAGITPLEETHPYFLHILMNRHPYFLAFDDGAKQTNLSVADVLEFETYYPKYVEQIKIGEYFRNLDHLITLHQRNGILNLHKYSVQIAVKCYEFTYVWEQRKLGDMSSSFEYGLNAAAKAYDGKNKYIRITDIDDNSREFLKSDLTSPDCNLEDADKYLLEEGDIVFARTGASVGKTYIYKALDGLVYYAGFLIRAKIKPEYNADFVFYNTLTKEYEKFIYVTSQRSGQPGVNAQEYASFEIMTPKIDEQRKIGKFFRNLDHLITLHQRKYARLCKIKKLGYSLYAWEQRKLSEVAEIIGGGTPSTNVSEYWDGDIDWYAPAEINDQIYVDGSERKITKLGLEKSSAKMLPANRTVLFTSRAGIGKTAILRSSGATNQGFQSMVLNDETNPYFVFSMSDTIKEKAERVASGSTFAEISGKMLGNLEFMFPTKSEQDKIGAYFERLDHLITLHQRKLFARKWRKFYVKRSKKYRLLL